MTKLQVNAVPCRVLSSSPRAFVVHALLRHLDQTWTRQLLDEAAQTATLADNNFDRSMAMQQLGLIQAHQRDYLAAGQSLLEMIHHSQNKNDRGTTVSGLGTLACVFAALGVQEPAIVSAIWVGD